VISGLTFEEVVYEYQDRVYNTCLGFLKNETEAKDAAQEVFINIYKKVNSFKGESSLSTWIYRITVNICLGELRKAKTKKRWGSIIGTDSKSATQIAADPFYHPGVELENKERSAILFGAIETLPEQQKVAFTLHKLENLSYDEIGQIMKKSLSSIESLIHRAKINLRAKLKNYYEENR